MIIKSIRLNNIRSYVNEAVEFPEGTVLLSGDIGSGKSTILLAMEFALFGIMKGSLEGDSLLRMGKTAGSVELALDIDGKQVVIKRNLKKSREGIRQDSGYIIVGGIKTEGTAEELKSRVLELLGYPKSLLTKSKSLIYRYTVYTPQEAMKQILLEDKESRIDTLRKVFKIDRYKRIRENSAVVTKELKTKAREQEARTEDLGEKKLQKEKTARELKEIEQEIRQIEPKLKQSQAELKEQAEKIRELEEKTKKKTELKKSAEINLSKLDEKNKNLAENNSKAEKNKLAINELKEKIVQIAVEESELELIKEREKELSQLIEAATEARQALKSLQLKIAEYEKELEASSAKTKTLAEKEKLKQQLEFGIKEKEAVKKLIAVAEEELANAREILSKNHLVKDESEKKMSSISRLELCPTCFQQIGEGHRHQINTQESKRIEEAMRAIDEILTKEAELKNKLAEEKNEIESIINKEKLLEKTTAEISALQYLENNALLKKQELEKLKREQSGHKAADIEQLKQEQQNLISLQMQLMQKKNLASLLIEKENEQKELSEKATILKLEAEIIKQATTELKKELEQFEGIDKLFEKEKASLEDVREKEKALLIKKASLNQQAESLNTKIEELQDEIKKKEEIIKENRRTKQLINWTETHFTGLMETIEKQVMYSIYQQFNELFQKWFSVLMEGANISARLDEEFTPIVEQNGYDLAIDNLSGGEKTSLALAYRLALNRVINDLITGIKTRDIIILDEPTDGFSEEQLEKVREVIEQLNTKQTIIVSHEAKVESFVQNIIRVQKQEHVSRIIS